MRIYVFNNEATAEAFKLTAYHFGYEATRVGSAIVMDPAVYAEIREKTYATPATLVGEEVTDD